MCGIVGLFLKDDRYSSELGCLLEPMLVSLSDRGPDSAGFAVYGDGIEARAKITVHAPTGGDSGASNRRNGGGGRRRGRCCPPRRSFRPDRPQESGRGGARLARVARARSRRDEYRRTHRDLQGRGSPSRGRQALRSHLDARDARDRPHAHGDGIRQSRNGAHPFSTGLDQCLVHNGSLSNHNSVRRQLVRDGFTFSTENDTEVAAAYLSWRMRQGMNLGEALQASLTDLDGFYTFVVGTDSGFGVLRDPIACKPAVMAETESLCRLWHRISRAGRAARHRHGARLGAGAGARLFLGAQPVKVVDLAETSLRDLNAGAARCLPGEPTERSGG